ncbi:MAG TPA: DoxX family protein [Rubellimicrobium sp.]|nr:DoxX family protein [Rubellimicrobium sp.]
MTPRFVNSILESEALWAFARVLITFMYWFAGLGFALDPSGAQAMMGGFGLQPAWLIAVLTIGVQVLGSLLIISDRLVWLGAGMLGVFTLLTIPLVHAFWTMPEPQATQARLESEEHLTVIGGLIVVSILSHVRREWTARRTQEATAPRRA